MEIKQPRIDFCNLLQIITICLLLLWSSIINGIKNNTGWAIQTGNVARFYADILKLQWLYEEKRIKNAVYVCLSKESQRESYLSNTIHIERALREADFFNNIITLPILFISLDFI